MQSVLSVMVRGALAFATLLLFTRLLGKQQLGQLTYFEYVTGLTIGSLAAGLTTDLRTEPGIYWVGLLMWAGLTFLTQFVTLCNRKSAVFLAGEPTVVVSRGRILEENMRRNRYRFEDLFSELRQQGIFSVSEVEVALLECNGHLSVMKRDSARQGPPLMRPLTVVQEGEVLRANLEHTGHDLAWLRQELERQGIFRLADVTVAVVEPDGRLFVDTYKDGLPPS